MTGIEISVAESIAQWAELTRQIRRVWVFGSRAKGTHRPDSDIDVAIELDALEDSEQTLALWIAQAGHWESQLQSRIGVNVDLEWFDPDGSTPTIECGLTQARVLVYERVT
jgi:predicted nucleotidyltransferase